MEILDAISFFLIPGAIAGFFLGRLDLKERIALARAEGHSEGTNLLWPLVVRYVIADLLRANQRPGNDAANKAAGGESITRPPLH